MMAVLQCCPRIEAVGADHGSFSKLWATGLVRTWRMLALLESERLLRARGQLAGAKSVVRNLPAQLPAVCCLRLPFNPALESNTTALKAAVPPGCNAAAVLPSLRDLGIHVAIGEAVWSASDAVAVVATAAGVTGLAVCYLRPGCHGLLLDAAAARLTCWISGMSASLALAACRGLRSLGMRCLDNAVPSRQSQHMHA